jgi:hypothetical protein
MTEPTRYQIWHGRNEPPRQPRELRAGPVTQFLDGRDLRNVRYGGVTLVDRVYVAVRDRNWGTVPGEPERVEVEEDHGGFTVRFDCSHRQNDLDVTWRGEIVGTSDGVVSYEMDARWNRDATYKLIGFNTHHGMREAVGRPYRGHGPNGPVSGVFPELIYPQNVVDGTEVPVFPPVETLTIALTDGVDVRFDFEGDPFEVEDQRNWTDASFKAQSFTPRRSGFYVANEGDHVRQKVTITPVGTPPPLPATSDRVRLTIGEPTGRTLPPIGLGMASHGQPLSTHEADLLRALRPDHLRVDLRLGDPHHVRALDHAIVEAATLGAALELALFAGDDADRELSFIAARLLGSRPRVRQVLVYPVEGAATPARLTRIARDRLRDVAPGALIVGGTDANFCELNRERPERAPAEGVVYSINPQIHAFDDRSLAENLAPQGMTVETARSIYGDRPIVVSPVTLKQRFNAVASEVEEPPLPGELPPQVDPRQMSLFGAGWTLGSVKYLAEAGAASITYFETTGSRGVMETEIGSAVPDQFASLPGMVFPVYHVLADLAEWKGAEIVTMDAGDAFMVLGLAVRDGGGLHLLVANLSPESQEVALGPLDGEIGLRRLDAENALSALTQPVAFRGTGERSDLQGEDILLSLAPYEYVRIDAKPVTIGVSPESGEEGLTRAAT